MDVLGLTMVRNEEEIITDTLDHMASFADFLYVYDDCSEDRTPEICRAHPSVVDLINKPMWDPDWPHAQSANRNVLLSHAKRGAARSDWLVYIDADERIEWARATTRFPDADAVTMKLYDYYITPDDVDKRYTERIWIGPEYRTILIAFRAGVAVGYWGRHQREATLKKGAHVVQAGDVRHYGKAISVQQWEDTCSFYERYAPRYAAKWAARHGKAIHTMSDFGRPLIRWEDRNTHGVPMQKGG